MQPCSQCACKKEQFLEAVVCSSLQWQADLNLHEQLHKAPADTRVNDGLDLVIGAVWEVRQGPAGICQQVWVTAE